MHAPGAILKHEIRSQLDNHHLSASIVLADDVGCNSGELRGQGSTIAIDRIARRPRVRRALDPPPRSQRTLDADLVADDAGLHTSCGTEMSRDG